MNEKYKNEIQRNRIFQDGEKVAIEYCLQCKEYALLEQKYHIAEIAGEGDLCKALNLLQWVNAHIHHTGNYDNSDKQDSLTLMELAFDKDYGINCLAMSVVLCECLLAVGVRARVVYMMPNDAEFFFSEHLNYNGNEVEDLEDLKEYYAKNLFFLRCKSRQGYGEHIAYGNMLEIAPAQFDVHKRMVTNLLYRIKTYGNCEVFTLWKNYESDLCNRYIDIHVFYR